MHARHYLRYYNLLFYIATGEIYDLFICRRNGDGTTRGCPAQREFRVRQGS